MANSWNWINGVSQSVGILDARVWVQHSTSCISFYLPSMVKQPRHPCKIYSVSTCEVGAPLPWFQNWTMGKKICELLFEALVMKMVNWKHIYLVFFCTARKKYLSHTFSNCPYSRYSQPVGNGLAERTSRSSAPWKNLASHGIKHIPSDHVFNWGEIEIYLPQISWVYLF